MKFIVIIVPVILQHFVQPRVPLTPLSFVPPGGWNECEPSGGRDGMGGREGREGCGVVVRGMWGVGGTSVLQGALMLI